MERPIAVLADIHGNSPAFEAVIEALRHEGCTRTYVLGDIINGVDPKGCLDLLRELPGPVCLKGNAEHYLMTPDLARFPRREEPPYRTLIPLLNWWRARLSRDDLLSIGQMTDWRIDNETCFVHDSPQDRIDAASLEGIDARYRELCRHGRGLPDPETAAADARPFMDARGLRRLFCGHTHEPYVARIDGGFICNAGSVGLPLDGDPRAGWVLWDPGTDPERVEIRRIPYDIEKTLWILDHRCEGFPENRPAYREMLRSGRHWSRH